MSCRLGWTLRPSKRGTTSLDDAEIAYGCVLGPAELRRSGQLSGVDLVDPLLALAEPVEALAG